MSNGGYGPAPRWLTQEVLGRVCGGRGRQQWLQALREYTEQAVREGIAEGPWERLMGGVVLGSQPLAQALGQRLKGSARERPSLKSLGPRLGWADIVGAIERVKEEPWEQFRDGHGDWGRDRALWLGRGQGRTTLRSLGEQVAPMDYAAVGAAISRMDRRLRQDAALARLVRQCQKQLKY